LDEAVTLLERVLADRTAEAGPDDRGTLKTKRSLVAALRQAGRNDDAVEQGRELVERSTELFSANDPDTLAAKSNLGVALIGVDAAEAERVLRETLAAALDVFGADDMRTAIVRQNLARALRVRGQHAEAEQQLREAVAVQFALGRVDDPEVLKMLVDRADSLVALGRSEPALSVLTVGEALGRRLNARDDLWPDERRDVREALSRAGELRAHAESR